jgi:uncharacterized membrane protein YhiD involved in acid resistance
VTGIEFIGRGVILKDKPSVRGTATAALFGQPVWLVSPLGLAGLKPQLH